VNRARRRELGPGRRDLAARVEVAQLAVLQIEVDYAEAARCERERQHSKASDHEQLRSSPTAQPDANASHSPLLLGCLPHVVAAACSTQRSTANGGFYTTPNIERKAMCMHSGASGCK